MYICIYSKKIFMFQVNTRTVTHVYNKMSKSMTVKSQTRRENKNTSLKKDSF